MSYEKINDEVFSVSKAEKYIKSTINDMIKYIYDNVESKKAIYESFNSYHKAKEYCLSIHIDYLIQKFIKKELNEGNLANFEIISIDEIHDDMKDNMNKFKEIYYNGRNENFGFDTMFKDSLFPLINDNGKIKSTIEVMNEVKEFNNCEIPFCFNQATHSLYGSFKKDLFYVCGSCLKDIKEYSKELIE